MRVKDTRGELASVQQIAAHESPWLFLPYLSAGETVIAPGIVPVGRRWS